MAPFDHFSRFHCCLPCFLGYLRTRDWRAPRRPAWIRSQLNSNRRSRRVMSWTKSWPSDLLNLSGLLWFIRASSFFSLNYGNKNQDGTRNDSIIKYILLIYFDVSEYLSICACDDDATFISRAFNDKYDVTYTGCVIILYIYEWFWIVLSISLSRWIQFNSIRRSISHNIVR